MKQVKISAEDDSVLQPFYAMYQPAKVGTFKINIHSGIQHPDQFMFAIQALEAADEDNDVFISLQSPGGSLDSTDLFLHHMRECKGHIHTLATGNCSSAASLILLASHTFELSDNFSSTIHCGSLGYGGTLSEYKQQTEFSVKFMEKVMRTQYAGFLNPAELEAMINGKDIVIDAEGWVARHEARNEYLKAKYEAAMKPPRKQRKPKQKLLPTPTESAL